MQMVGLLGSFALFLAVLSGCSVDETRTAASALIPTATATVAPTQGDTEPVPSEEIRSTKERVTSSADNAIPEELVQGNSAFALDLYSHLAPEKGNFFFSPYSISLALSMTYAGARGETESQMAEVLHFLPPDLHHDAFNALDLEMASRGETYESENEGYSFKLNISNAVWAQKDYEFTQRFLDTLSGSYGAGVRQIDFRASPEGARVAINDWVEERTEDRIKDLIPPDTITEDTAMVLANAIYFKARWFYEFDPAATRPHPFHLLDGSSIDVPMMRRVDDFSYSDGEGYQAVHLPYIGGMSMIVLLPDRGRFREFEKSLNAELVSQIAEEFRQHVVTLDMPKFKFESDFQLSETLKVMGMPNAFDSNSDFSGMDGRSCIAGDGLCLSIDAVVHKAFVSVDEEGTEAAAATGIVARLLSGPPPREATFTVDRPFIFLIRDYATGSVLFMGRVETIES